MLTERLSGVLLHPTSLPGPHGIGDLGSEAARFIDWLATAGCSLWQVLPLGPTGYGDSPYQCFSSFAGNPNLVDPDGLVAAGYLEPADLADYPDLPADHVDYGAVIPAKARLLDAAAARHRQTGHDDAFESFRDEHAAWLDDFALFMALKEAHGGRSWVEWEPGFRDREPPALADAAERHADRIHDHAFRQFVFFEQWDQVRNTAAGAGIRIVGDLPIFVAHDSADVWAERELFTVDQHGNPEVVAGVPPDYFSETGQLWGNPLYRWDLHRATGYAWWLSRLRSVLSLVDIVRIDHFRGFADYWEIPAGAETAVDGRWLDGPGADFFSSVGQALGDLPIIAEDLGELSDAVEVLRDQFGLPGMKILQFAFDADDTNPFLPHNFTTNCVVYTGTHDNDTTVGWFEKASPEERDNVGRYLGIDGSSIAWDLIRAGWESRAAYALAPLQDLLGLGSEARMNYPGKPAGNWKWRALADQVSRPLAERLHTLNERTGRLAG